MHDHQARRQQLYALLGELPERDRPISGEVIRVEERSSYLLETLALDLNGIEAVPAYFSRPKGLAEPAPTIVFNHSHGGHYERGKREFVEETPALQSPPYAEQLAQLGYCGLCIDSWNFGERRGRSESELFKELLWKGQVLWGLMIYDSLRAVDYVTSRPEVDASRLGTLGISMGSTTAWWLAALDERIRVCVDICCLTDFQSLIETRGLDGHGLYYYVPGLLKHFSTSNINALIAPRPHLALAGNFDRLTPPQGLDRVDTAMRAAYAEMGVAERWQLLRYDTGHFETAHGRAAIVAFLQRWL